MKYSCQNKPAQYKLLHAKVDFPMPKGNTYYWHIVNFTNDMDKFKVILAFEKVMATWQRAFDGIAPIGPHIDFKSTDELSEAHFIFSFGPREHTFLDKNNTKHMCPFDFDGAQGVLAHAWSLNSGHPYGGQIHFDESEQWADMHKWSGSKMFTHLYTVVLHEMGHCFDLAHSNVKQAVMYPSYNGEKPQLHPDDLLGLAKKMSPIKKKIYKNLKKKPNAQTSSFSLLQLWYKFLKLFR